MAQEGVRVGPDFPTQTKNYLTDYGIFPREVQVESFFAHPQLGCDIVHGDRAVATDQKIGAGLSEDTLTQVRFDWQFPGDFDDCGHDYLGNHNRFLGFLGNGFFHLSYFS